MLLQDSLYLLARSLKGSFIDGANNIVESLIMKLSSWCRVATIQLWILKSKTETKHSLLETRGEFYNKFKVQHQLFFGLFVSKLILRFTFKLANKVFTILSTVFFYEYSFAFHFYSNPRLPSNNAHCTLFSVYL